ncbi:hypothetical protein GCM10027563_45380 [Parasphingorhabdus pacifica]
MFTPAFVLGRRMNILVVSGSGDRQTPPTAAGTIADMPDNVVKLPKVPVSVVCGALAGGLTR